MKKNILILLPAMLFAISCGKVGLNPETGRAPMSIIAVSPQIGGDVKSHWIYDYDICWDENDKIYVKGSDGADTFTLTDGAGTSKGTFTQDGTATISGDVQAYYPAAIYDADTQVTTWPEIQTDKVKFPLYCTKTITGGQNEVFDFKSLGGVVKVYFATEDKNIKIRSMELKDKTKPMSGEFTVDDDGQAVITSTENHGVSFFYNNVAVGAQTRYLNIFVPAGTYEHVTLLLTSSNSSTCMVELEEPLVVRQGEVAKVMASGSFVAHAFSVSDTKKVIFSQGNLYYDGSGFKFEKNQLDYETSWSENHVSHFLWSSNSEVACRADYDDSEASETDILFTNETSDTPRESFSVEGVKGQFRALSAAEWDYLLFSSKRAGMSAYSVAICPKAYTEYFCTILYPDDYDGEKVDNLGKIRMDEWLQMEQHGAICLPSAGRRYGKAIIGAAESGVYWLSDSDNSLYGNRIYFNKYFMDQVDRENRSYGCSIRLVRDAE